MFTEIRVHSMIPGQLPYVMAYSSLQPPVQCIKLLDLHIVSSILVVTRGRQVHSPDIPSQEKGKPGQVFRIFLKSNYAWWLIPATPALKSQRLKDG